MKYLIANLKEHQNQSEAVAWINQFVNGVHSSTQIQQSLRADRLRVIIAPSEPFLITFKHAIHGFKNIFLSSQDISEFAQGSYTGESGSHTLAGIVQFSIIGHSERRRFLNESQESVKMKVKNASEAKIIPILCVSSPADMSALSFGLVAYEPADAIGSGKNYPVETVLEFKQTLALADSIPFLYGGSADENNMRLYLKHDEIGGLLVGTASRDARQFCSMLQLV